MFDMTKCKPGDQLVLRDGTIVTYICNNGDRIYPHYIEYSIGLGGTRTNDGRSVGKSTIANNDVVGFALTHPRKLQQTFYGIRTPGNERQDSYLWWISNTQDKCWELFFTYPNKDNRQTPYRLSMDEAIKAYKAIGYKCVKLTVTEEEEEE